MLRQALTPPPRSLTDAVIRTAGFSRRSWRLIVFIHEWALIEAAAGERIGIERYAAESVDSTRTAYNRLREFRETFYGSANAKQTPADMIVWPDGLPAREAIESDRVAWELVPA